MTSATARDSRAAQHYSRSGDIDKLLEEVLSSADEFAADYDDDVDGGNAVYAQVCKQPGGRRCRHSGRPEVPPAVTGARLVLSRPGRSATAGAGAGAGAGCSPLAAAKRCRSHEVLESVSIFRVHPPPLSPPPLEDSAAREAEAVNGKAYHHFTSASCHRTASCAEAVLTNRQQWQQTAESSRVGGGVDRFCVSQRRADDASRCDVAVAADAEYTEIAALHPIGRGVRTLKTHRVRLPVAAGQRYGRGHLPGELLDDSVARRSLHRSEPALQRVPPPPTPPAPPSRLQQQQRRRVEVRTSTADQQLGAARLGCLRAATFQASDSEPVQHSQLHHLSTLQHQRHHLQRNQLLEQAIVSVAAEPLPMSTRAAPAPPGWQLVATTVGQDDPLLEAALATCQLWYRPGLGRDEASGILKAQQPGSFLIRGSSSHSGCCDLALRVPRQQQQQQQLEEEEEVVPAVRHFLLDRCSGGGFRVRGLPDEPRFASLSALVAAHAGARLGLPCRLRLPPKPPAPPTHQPPECDALYLAAVDVETVTGAAAVAKATEALMRNRHRLGRPTRCRLRAMPDGGVRIGGVAGDGCDSGGEKCIQAASIVHCGFDPGLRSFDSDETDAIGLARPRIFGLVLRKRAGSSAADHVTLLACDSCDPRRAESVVQFVRSRLGL